MWRNNGIERQYRSHSIGIRSSGTFGTKASGHHADKSPHTLGFPGPFFEGGGEPNEVVIPPGSGGGHVGGDEPPVIKTVTARCRQAMGSWLTNGIVSQRLPAATMQLLPAGVVLTTVQVCLVSDV